MLRPPIEPATQSGHKGPKTVLHLKRHDPNRTTSSYLELTQSPVKQTFLRFHRPNLYTLCQQLRRPAFELLLFSFLIHFF